MFDIRAACPGRSGRRRIAGLVAAVLLAGLCFGKMKVEFDKKVDFSRYKTYQWYPPRILKKTGVSEDDDVVAPLIKSAVNRELMLRNLTPVKDGGDLRISTWALSESVPHVDALIFPGAGPPGVPSPAPQIAFGGSPITVGRYNKQGTIVVNLIDSATSKSAWAAMVTDSYSGLNEIEGKINKAVEQMFKKYPVKPQ